MPRTKSKVRSGVVAELEGNSPTGRLNFELPNPLFALSPEILKIQSRSRLVRPKKEILVIPLEISYAELERRIASVYSALRNNVCN
jgi:hypothetical protein